MTPDELKQTWNAQASNVRLTIDMEKIDAEARQFQKQFSTMLFWRDVREVGTAAALIPIWIFLGLKLALPWSWYLIIPVLIWIAAYMLVDRIRHRTRQVGRDEPLCRQLESNLAQVEHQISLLQSILWWCLLPLSVPMTAFVLQVAFSVETEIWITAGFLVFVGSIIGAVFCFVYRMNLHAVRTYLVPRRDELRSQLRSLQE